MSSKPNINTLMIRYMSGTATAEEKKRLSSRLREETQEARDARRVLDVHLKLNVLLGPERGADATADMVIDESCAGQKAERTSPQRERILRFTWRRTLSAAATLLAVLGIWAMLGPLSTTRDVRAVSATGHPENKGSEWQTDANSSVHLEYKDGSDVCVGPDTRARVGLNAAGRKSIEQMSGSLYLRMAQQEKPFRVKVGSAELEVKGTRFLSRADDKQLSDVWLTEGSLDVKTKWASVTLRPRQRAISAGNSNPDAPHPLLHVSTFDRTDMDGLELDWLSSLDFDRDRKMLREPAPFKPLSGGSVNLDEYSVALGRWTIRRKSGEVILAKENTGRGLILFGKPKWKHGRISCKFRFAGEPSSSTKLVMGLYYFNRYSVDIKGDEPTAWNYTGNKKTRLWEPGSPWSADVFDILGVSVDDLDIHNDLKSEWWQMELRFQMKKNNRSVMDYFAVWPVNKPDERKNAFAPGRGVVRTPDNSAVKRRNRAGLAIQADGSAIEIKDLKVKGE